MIRLHIVINNVMLQDDAGWWVIPEDSLVLPGERFSDQAAAQKALAAASRAASGVIKQIGITQELLQLLQLLVQGLCTVQVDLAVQAVEGIVIFPGDRMLSVSDAIMMFTKQVRRGVQLHSVEAVIAMVDRWQGERREFMTGQD